MDEIEYYDSELEEGKRDIKRMLKRINGLSDAEREKAISDIQSKIKTANTNLKRFRKTLNTLDAERTKKKYTELRDRHRNELKKFEKDLEICKSQADRDSLFGGSAEPEKKKEKPKKASQREVITKTANGRKKIKDESLEKELFKDVFQEYEESLDIVNRIINTADETQKVAVDSLEMLAKQKEQLKNVDNELDKMSGAMKTAQKELSSFMRRIMRTKIILLATAVIIGLVLLCVVALAVYLILMSLGVCMHVLIDDDDLT